MKILSLFFLLVLSACYKTGTPEHQIFQKVDSVEKGQSVTYQDINRLIIEPFACAQCHSDWAGSEEGLKQYIVPGEPFSSALYTEIENGNMPMGGPVVDKARLEFLEEYIRQLKP